MKELKTAPFPGLSISPYSNSSMIWLSIGASRSFSISLSQSGSTTLSRRSDWRYEKKTRDSHFRFTN